MSIFKPDVLTTRRVRALLYAMLETQDYTPSRLSPGGLASRGDIGSSTARLGPLVLTGTAAGGGGSMPIARKVGDLLCLQGGEPEVEDGRWTEFFRLFREAFKGDDLDTDHEWLIWMRGAPKSFGRFLIWVHDVITNTEPLTIPSRPESGEVPGGGSIPRKVYLRTGMSGGQRVYSVRLADEIAAAASAEVARAAAVAPKVGSMSIDAFRALVREEVGAAFREALASAASGEPPAPGA